MATLPPLARAIADGLTAENDAVHLPEGLLQRTVAELATLPSREAREREAKGLLVLAGRLVQGSPAQIAKTFTQIVFLALVAIHGRTAAESLVARNEALNEASRLLSVSVSSLPVQSTAGSRVFDFLLQGKR